MNLPAQSSGARAGATGVLLVAFFISLYTLSYNGLFRVDDEHILAARAQSLALWGRLEEPQVYGNLRVQALSAFGDQATQIEPLQSVLGACLYRLGIALDLGGAQALFALNITTTALTAGIVFAAVRVLGYRRRTALWCGVLFGVGTMAWPYAVTLYRDTLAMGAASLAFLGWSTLIAGRRPRAGAALLVLGIASGILTKNTIVALLVSLALTALVMAASAVRSRAANPTWQIGVLAILVIAAGLASLLIQPEGELARFSWSYYSSLVGHFTEGWGTGILATALGPWISPAKSVFLFSPPLLLAAAGIIGAWKRNWRVSLPAVVFAILLGVGQALFYRERWAGAFGWGLRFMLPAVPLLMIASAPAVEALDGRFGRKGKAVLAGMLALSAVIQLAGSWVDPRATYLEWQRAGLDPYTTLAAWQARFLAVGPQVVRLVDPASWSVAWARLARLGVPEAALAPLAAALLGGVSLVYLLRASPAMEARRKAAATILGLLAMVLPIAPTLMLYRSDPAFGGDRTELTQAAHYLEDRAVAGDRIVVDAYGTPLWAYMMNHWESPVEWYSLPFEIPGTPGVDASCTLPPMTSSLLFETAEPGARLIYATSTDAPDYDLGREVCQLDQAYDLEAQATFGGEGEVEIRVYRIR